MLHIPNLICGTCGREMKLIKESVGLEHESISVFERYKVYGNMYMCEVCGQCVYDVNRMTAISLNSECFRDVSVVQAFDFLGEGMSISKLGMIKDSLERKLGNIAELYEKEMIKQVAVNIQPKKK